MRWFRLGNGNGNGNAAKRREILAFTWPVILTNLLQSLTVTVNMIMVGNLGDEAGRDAIAGVGLGSQVVFLAHAIMMAVSAGTIALIARHIGAGEKKKAERVMEQSIWLSLILTIPLTLAGWFLGGYIIDAFPASPEVQALGETYVKFVFLGTAFSFFEFIMGAALRGAGDMKTPMIMAAITNIVNIAVGYVLIFGYWGFPQMGVLGAAVANIIGFAAGAGVYLYLLMRRKLRLNMPIRRMGYSKKVVRRIMRIGSPAAAEQAVLQVGFLFYTAIIVYFGTAALAGHQIGARIQGLAFMPGMGFAMAATALVGLNLGAKKPQEAEESGWEATKLSMLLMCGIGAVMFVFAEPMARLFVPDTETIDYAALWIRLQALAMPAIGIHFTLSGALRGAGDTHWPLNVAILGMFVVRLPMAILLGFTFGLGILGAWIAFVVEYSVRAAIIAWRFRLGAWKTIKV
ncbi:MAG: MATE family efflux transporter [Thermoplasmata archaeon]|nr:MATE family efflux transporter [Thermoplasmata archaeon]